MLHYTRVNSNLQKIKNFTSEIFKLIRSGKPDIKEPLQIMGCVYTNINDKYNITPKILTVNYADMLPPITKNMQVKNNYILLEIGTVEQYKGITCSSSIRWCVL